MVLALLQVWILLAEKPLSTAEPLAATLCELLTNTVPGSAADEDDLEVRATYRVERGDIFLDIAEVYYAAGTKKAQMIERKTVPVSQISKVSERAAPIRKGDGRFYVLISFTANGGAYQYSSDQSDANVQIRTFQLGLFSKQESAEILQLLDRLTALFREPPP